MVTLVQGYLQVLSRPLALSQDSSLIDWSLPYQDAAVIIHICYVIQYVI